MTAEPSDEWTMLCPPGRMDDAVASAEIMPENIREIIETPLAGDSFILVNDSELARTWQRIIAAPVEFRPPPQPVFPSLINDPTALIRLSGI